MITGWVKSTGAAHIHAAIRHFMKDPDIILTISLEWKQQETQSLVKCDAWDSQETEIQLILQQITSPRCFLGSDQKTQRALCDSVPVPNQVMCHHKTTVRYTRSRLVPEDRAIYCTKLLKLTRVQKKHGLVKSGGKGNLSTESSQKSGLVLYCLRKCDDLLRMHARGEKKPFD